jgi:hypothetical protein
MSQIVVEQARKDEALAIHTPMDLLAVALQKEAAIDVIERLAALQEKAMSREALIDFNEALNRVQEKIKRIAPDLENPDKKSKYASYAAIDRVIRPIYSAEGFSLSFTHADSPKPDHVRIVCRVSLRAHVEMYQIDMPVDTTGPKGTAMMTKTHATAASDSYGKRYLVKDIFNIAIGEEDRDGNAITFSVLDERLDWIESCRDETELQKIFTQAYKDARQVNDQRAMQALIAAKDKKRGEFRASH